MPQPLPKPCAEPGCTALVRAGSRCSQHQRPSRTHALSRSQRGYTRAFYRLRTQAIAAQPWCERCGATTRLTGEHRIPLSRGGANTPDNIAVLCVSCNSARGNR